MKCGGGGSRGCNCATRHQFNFGSIIEGVDTRIQGKGTEKRKFSVAGHRGGGGSPFARVWLAKPFTQTEGMNRLPGQPELKALPM